MKKNFVQYDGAVNSASEVAEALADMEGGAFVLAWTAELIRGLATAENFEGASLAVQKLCETSGVKRHWAEQEGQGRGDEKIWLGLFAEVLMDRVIAVTQQPSLYLSCGAPN